VRVAALRDSPSKTAAIIFVVSLVYFVSYMRYGGIYDEGYLLDGVERVFNGQLIYRDFHHTYAPGRFYLVAAAFRLFGKNLLVERFVFALFQAIKCAVGFLIVWRIRHSVFALLAPVLIMIAPGPWHKVFFSSLGFIALYTMIVSFKKGPRRLLLSGLVVGVCAVFRQDVAGFAAVGGAIAMLIDVRASKGTLFDFGRRLGYLLLGIAVVVVPVMIYFQWQGALRSMIHDIAVAGMRDNRANSIPYPPLGAITAPDLQYLAWVLPAKLLFYAPFAVYGVSAALLLRRALTRKWLERHTCILVMLIVSVMAFNQSVWRSDLGHLMQTMQYVYLLVAVLSVSGHEFLARSVRIGVRGAGVLKYAILLIMPVMLCWASVGCVMGTTTRDVAARLNNEGILVISPRYLGSMFVRLGNDTRADLKRAPVYVTPHEAALLAEIGRFLNLYTSPGEYVLAVPHFQSLYFLFDRRNPTRYAHYRRRLDRQDEDQYIEDIRSHDTIYILLTEPFEGAKVGYTRESFSEYALRVREWIFDNYLPVGKIDSFTILRRKI
jgi:hypothetical protein